MKPIIGQYECMHRSGVGLDYFTSRIDRLVLYPNGRFLLTIQQMSRAANAAKAWFTKDTTASTPPQTQLEGHYTQQQSVILLFFDNSGFEEAHLSSNEDGIQVGPNYFTKVSDAPTLPSLRRMKQDMDDIAKGLQIATTIGNVAKKAAKTFQAAINSATPNQEPAQTTHAPSPPPTKPSSAPQNPPSPNPVGARFCNQCGTHLRPGKRFCPNCGTGAD
jgi:hypothetical protein